MHKLFTRFLAVGMLLLGTAAVSSAAQFPNATCPDSVTIQQIQDVTALCHPAVGDTVRGIAGVITGFDPIATGFDLYFQDPLGGPFSGIDVFTHSVNTKVAPFNYAIGDLVVVELMKTAEFQNSSEIFAINNSFASPNFIIRKVSSGNTLPPFFVGTTTQLQEASTNVTGEQYEQCLVKIVGPLTVVRTSVTGGLGQNNGFLVIDPLAPSDSVFIDGNKLTTYAPPAVGTPILSVQGILNQNTRGYRIMLRDGNDIISNTPPNVSDAYPITDTDLLVRFDRDVTAGSATTLTNYSLGSGGSVLGAVMSGTDRVTLTINNGLAHGDVETVTINGVVGLAAGLPMTTPQTRTFINGLLSAADIQAADGAFINADTSCVDRSRFAGLVGEFSQGGVGTRLSMAAIVTGRYGSLYYMSDAGQPARGGVVAFAPPAVLAPGTKYRLTGQIQEFFGETEFSNIIEATSLGAVGVPAANIIDVIRAKRDTCDNLNLFNDGEDNECMLVTLPAVKVVQRFPTLPTNGFHVTDQSFPDTMFVENLNAVLTPLVAPALGQLVTVTGVVHYTSGSFRVCPRNYADIVDLGVAGVDGNAGRLAFSVYPNPARTAKFSFSLPQSEDVSIGIFDVAGREIVSLFKGRLPAGSYSREWSGLDGAGRNVGAGVFFARMKAGAETRAIRTVYLGR
jgi:hypothetical protein